MARIAAFTGRFGSGKTEVSINYACGLAAAGADVALVDLDIVTPYFRSRDVAEWPPKRMAAIPRPSA